MKSMIILAEQQNVQIDEKTINKVLDYINHYYFLYQKIDLDDIIWYEWFFNKINKYINDYINIRQLVKNKRQEMKTQLQQYVNSYLCKYICSDIINHIIFSYL